MLLTHGGYSLLISWILLGLVVSYLPWIIKNMKLQDKTTPQIISLIRAGIIVYLIISFITFFSNYVATFLQGAVFFYGR